MKAAIIGATGFIGAHLSETCTGRGDRLSVLVRSPSAGEELKEKGIEVVLGDLNDEEALRRVCARADVVFNLAGTLGGWGVPSDELESVNARAPGRVVVCAAEAGAAKVVHVSTAGVTGPLPDGVFAGEEYPPQPATDYQRTKLGGEESARSAHERCGIPLTIVRPAFVYGPGDMHKFSLFRAVARKRLVLVDGGRTRLHPVFVDDLVEGMLCAGARGPGAGEVYILAGPCAATVRKLIETIAWALAVPAPSLGLPRSLLLGLAAAAELGGRMLGFEPPLTRSRVDLFSTNYAYCTDRARRELCFRPVTDLPVGVRMTADWYRKKGML